MERGVYDLSHFNFSVGEIGRLQTLACIPVVAGDSFDLRYDAIFRLSTLRRNLTVDVSLDKFIFYVPHRHVYGQDWIDFILQGIDETVTFPTVDLLTQRLEYLGYPELNGVIPKWLITGYNQIWDRYFRVPTDTTNVLGDTDISGTARQDMYGRHCARPKRWWTTGIDATTVAADREVSTAGNVMDILDLDQVKGRYKTEQLRDFFGQRYDDLLRSSFGSGVNVDADERPTLIMRKSAFMSGYDVDGTADATLGQYSGKAAAQCEMVMPRRFFPEHGTLWVMALLRFPTIHERELHYLVKKSQPTYKEISGDYDIWEREPPFALEIQDVFRNNSSSTQIGTVPYGQWYREHPHTVHATLANQQGFTFLATAPTTIDQVRYTQEGEYDGDFQSLQFAHWQSQGAFTIRALRPIPGPLRSVFAGVGR